MKTAWMYLSMVTLILALATAVIAEPEAASGGMSADEAAKQLANPNSSLASLTLKSQYRTFKGDLPGADDAESGTFLFQPAFPFPMSKTDNLFIRPAFTYLVNQPVVDPVTGAVGKESGFADIGYDVAYGRSFASGLLAVLGMVGSIPVGDDALTTDTWTLGPELFLGVFKPYGVFGVFPNHQWNVGGSRDVKTSLTSIQPFAVFLPGGGWSVGTAGICSYDWENDQWTVPLQLQVSRTVKVGKMPLKIALEGNYYVEKSDALGPDWMFGLNITPVVPNIFANWLGLQ